MTVKIFSFSEYNEMASALQRSDSFECTPFRLARYDNLELHATVPPITGEHCPGSWIDCASPMNDCSRYCCWRTH